MYWPITIAALVFLVTYTVHVVAQIHGRAAVITISLIVLAWLVFIVDYIVNLALSRPRGAWIRTHLDTLVMVIIPALRPVRLLDVFAGVATYRKSGSAALRARLLIYGAGSALLLVWFISLAVLQVERGARGATIVSFGDAVWWAFCTITTVGYGDYAPVTILGRVYAIILMIGGVVLVGLVVATISSAVVEQVSHRSREPHGLHLPHLHRGGSPEAANEAPAATDAPEALATPEGAPRTTAPPT